MLFGFAILQKSRYNIFTVYTVQSSYLKKDWRKKMAGVYKSIDFLPTIFNVQKYYHHTVSFICAWAMPQAVKDLHKVQLFRENVCTLPIYQYLLVYGSIPNMLLLTN